MNPMQFISLIKNRNPEELVMSMVQNNNINDPMITNLIQCAQKGDSQNLNKIAEEYCRKMGLDFGQEFNSFMSMLR